MNLPAFGTLGKNAKLTLGFRRWDFSSLAVWTDRRVSCKDLGSGDCEGWLYKRQGSRRLLTDEWVKRWCVIKDHYMYIYETTKVQSYSYFGNVFIILQLNHFTSWTLCNDRLLKYAYIHETLVLYMIFSWCILKGFFLISHILTNCIESAPLSQCSGRLSHSPMYSHSTLAKIVIYTMYIILLYVITHIQLHTCINNKLLV